jgi:spore maturation protein CgeB
MQKHMGLKNKEHLDTFTNMNDLENKIKYYLKNDKERENIANVGQTYVHNNHSWDKVTDKIIDIINTKQSVCTKI